MFYEVYNELGFGFLESVYREAMRIALAEAGFRVEAEVPVPVSFRGTLVGVFRADIVVDGKIIVELKTAETISPGAALSACFRDGSWVSHELRAGCQISADRDAE